MAVEGLARLGARLHAGDQSAVSDLFDALGGRIVTYCFRRTLEDRTSADLAELTFVDAWRLRERAPFTDHALEAWLFGLATARCRAHPLPPTTAPAGSASDELVLRDWWRWLRTLPEPERDAVMLTEWEHLSTRQVSRITHARPGQVARLLAAAGSTRPPGLLPVPSGHPVPADVGDALLERLMELPDAEAPARRGPRPALALTGVLVVALLVGTWLLTRAPAPEPPPSAPSAARDATLVQRCRAQKGFDPSLVRVQQAADGATLLVFFNLAGQVQLCGSLGDQVRLSDVAQPDSSGGSLGRLVLRQGDSVVVLMAGSLPSGTLRATVMGSPAGTTGWSGPVWWMSRTIPAQRLADEPPTVFVLFDGADATRTWLVPWVGSTVAPTQRRWEQAAGLCGAALHSDQPVPGLRLLIPGPGGPSASGFLVVSQDDRLWTCAVGGTAGWIGAPVSAAASGGSGVAVSTPQIMDAAQTLVLGGRVPAGVTSVRVDLAGASFPAVIDHGYWVWSRTVDNRLLPVQPNRVTVQMEGATPRTLVVDWLRDYAGVTVRTWTPLFGTPLGARCGAGTGPRAESLAGHVQVYAPGSGRAAMICFGTDDDMHRVAPAASPASLTLHVLAEPGRDGSRLFAAGGALPAGVRDIVVHTPGGPVAATTARGYWVIEWVAPGHPRAALPGTVRVTWTEDGRPMSRSVRVPSS